MSDMQSSRVLAADAWATQPTVLSDIEEPTLGRIAQPRGSSERAQLAAELAILHRRVEGLTVAVVEMFCLLAEHAPEMLTGEWALVADVVAAEERLWVYPAATLAQVEDEGMQAFVPYLNRQKLITEWDALLDHARLVHACRESGRIYGYEC